MQDLIEPYPSIMAEHFIKVGFGGAKLERVFHFWHSPLLSAAHYLPLAQDVDLVRGWTMLQKKNLKVQVKENK